MKSTGGTLLHHTPGPFSSTSVKQQNPSYPDTPPQTPSRIKQKGKSTGQSGSYSRQSTPEKHYKSRRKSHICPDWGPQCRDVEHLNATIYRYIKGVEQLEAEYDAQEVELGEERRKNEKLKQKLHTKAAKIESLESERASLLYEVNRWKVSYEDACSEQSNLTPMNDTVPDTCASVKPEQFPRTPYAGGSNFCLVACPPETLAAAYKLPTNKSSQMSMGLGISRQAQAEALPTIEAAPSVSQVKQEHAGSAMSPATFHSCPSYGSASSTPTIIRDCQSFSSSVTRPPVSPEFVGSPNWEPVYRLKDALKEMDQTRVRLDVTAIEGIEPLQQVSDYLSRMLQLQPPAKDWPPG